MFLLGDKSCHRLSTMSGLSHMRLDSTRVVRIWRSRTHRLLFAMLPSIFKCTYNVLPSCPHVAYETLLQILMSTVLAVPLLVKVGFGVSRRDQTAKLAQGFGVVYHRILKSLSSLIHNDLAPLHTLACPNYHPSKQLLRL